jgi:hypothetical protein
VIFLRPTPRDYFFPMWGCGSSSVIHACLAKMGRRIRGDPSAGILLPQFAWFSAVAPRMPEDAVCHVVGRDPIARFELAHALTGTVLSHLPRDCKQLIECARHSTDGHLVPISKLVRIKMKNCDLRFLRIEDAATWGPEFGLTAPHLHRIRVPIEPLPKRHRKAVLDLYRDDYEAFDYQP